MDQRVTVLRGEADDLQKERDAINQRVTVLRGAADDLEKALDGMDQRMGAARPGTVSDDVPAPAPSRSRRDQAFELVLGHPGITINEMAEAMGMRENYLYRLVPELEKEGMLRPEGKGWRAVGDHRG